PGEIDGDGATDPAVAPGDQRDAAPELICGFVRGLLRRRPRTHFRLAARALILLLRRTLLHLLSVVLGHFPASSTSRATFPYATSFDDAHEPADKMSPARRERMLGASQFGQSNEYAITH